MYKNHAVLYCFCNNASVKDKALLEMLLLKLLPARRRQQGKGFIALLHFTGSDQAFKHLVSSVTAINSNSSLVPRCNTVTEKRAKCVCQYEFCLSWYPCALKYCDDANQAGVSYRCGIKTCGKCRQFQYYVGQRNDCFWDTPFNDNGR